MPLQTLLLERGPRLSPGRLPGASVGPSWCFVIWRGLHLSHSDKPDCIQNDIALQLPHPTPTQTSALWLLDCVVPAQGGRAWTPWEQLPQQLCSTTRADRVWPSTPVKLGPRLRVVAASSCFPRGRPPAKEPQSREQLTMIL